jgi:hypothetical protein
MAHRALCAKSRLGFAITPFRPTDTCSAPRIAAESPGMQGFRAAVDAVPLVGGPQT